MSLDVDGLRGRHFLHGIGARIVWHRIRNLVDVVRVERINANSLAHWVNGIAIDVVHRIMHHGHRGLWDDDSRIGWRPIHTLKTFQLPVGNLIRCHARQKLASPSQFRCRVITTIQRRCADVKVHALLMTVAGRCQVVEHFVLGLLLRIEHLLQRQDFVDEKSVCLGNFGEQFLELLHLLLCGSELFSHDTDVMTGREILCGLCSPRGGSLSTNVIKIIFTAHSEIGMLEFESLCWGLV